MKTLTQERRRFVRGVVPPDVAIRLLSPEPSMLVGELNCSEGGMCFRMQEVLEVRSLVRLQWTPESRFTGVSAETDERSMQFTGRVAWVIQRLDLRAVAPFLYDIGVEFVDPPTVLRRLIAHRAGRMGKKSPRVAQKALPSAIVRGREYVARLERESTHPTRWHLVVGVDGVACFSGRYPSEQAALAAWARFKREQAKR